MVNNVLLIIPLVINNKVFDLLTAFKQSYKLNENWIVVRSKY